MAPQSRKQALPILLWSLIIVHQSKQHKPNVVGVCNRMDLRAQCGCGFDYGKSVGRMSKALYVFAVRCLVVQCLVVAISGCIRSH